MKQKALVSRCNKFLLFHCVSLEKNIQVLLRPKSYSFNFQLWALSYMKGLPRNGKRKNETRSYHPVDHGADSQCLCGAYWKSIQTADWVISVQLLLLWPTNGLKYCYCTGEKLFCISCVRPYMSVLGGDCYNWTEIWYWVCYLPCAY